MDGMRADPRNVGTTFKTSIGSEEARDNPPFTVGRLRVGSRLLAVSSRSVTSDLAGIFGVGFAHRHVGVFGWIGRFLDRKWLWL
jgi:hypothetical protein